MNIKLIKKYKEEFDYFISQNQNQVLMGKKDHFTNKIKWYPSVSNPFLELSDNIIIIKNDEYAEFRKALAEGKIIQQQDYYSKEWIDMKTDEFHGASDTQYEGIYRIKPEEPTFKVGDWVRAPSGYIYQINETNIIHGTEHFTPWQPQPGEWCWFHNGTVESLYFYKFHSIISEGYIADIPKDIEHVMTAQIFKYCEPFTGNLPTVIKDN